ncbi:FecR domain-containing protein [Pedobacter sp. NJ-S-72]
MIIDNEPLAAIAEKLQKWYGIEIYIANKEVKDYRYSGTFENESVIKTLEALQIAYPFEFKAEQNKITISK